MEEENTLQYTPDYESLVMELLDSTESVDLVDEFAEIMEFQKCDEDEENLIATLLHGTAEDQSQPDVRPQEEDVQAQLEDVQPKLEDVQLKLVDMDLEQILEEAPEQLQVYNNRGNRGIGGRGRGGRGRGGRGRGGRGRGGRGGRGRGGRAARVEDGVTEGRVMKPNNEN